jgi:hypothetical protein
LGYIRGDMRPSVAGLVTLALLSTFASSGQNAPAPDLVRLLPAEVSGWNRSAADRLYTRATISQYLKNEAGAYLAYGFRRLLVREYLGAPGASLVVEVYDMSTAADAYGVFSCGPDGEETPVGKDAVYTGGLLRFWKGPFFVRLTVKGEYAGTRPFLLGLGAKIAAAIAEEGTRPAILACLPQEELEKRSVRYFHKQASLDSQFYFVDENALLLDEGTEAVLGRYRQARGESMLLVCRYRTPADARRAYLKFSRVYFSGKIDERGDSVMEGIEAGEFAAARLAGACLILILESPGKSSCEALARATVALVNKVFPQPSRQN